MIHHLQMSAFSKRKLEHQQTNEILVEWVDDNEWNAIESAFDALSKPSRQDSSIISRSTAAILPMVPSVLLPLSTNAAAAAPHHRFYHHPSPPPGHSQAISRQIMRPGSLEQREYHCRTVIGTNPDGDGGGASVWTKAPGLPCQVHTRNNCPGREGTTRIQSASECPEFPSIESTSSEERAESASRPLEVELDQVERDPIQLVESLEHNFLPGALYPEMGVGPGPNSPDPLPQLCEAIATNDEEGSGESSKKQSTRRLPAWMEPARRFLLPMENSSSVEQTRDVSGLVKGVTNSETLEREEQTSRASAQQLARDVSGLVRGVTNSETLEREEQTSRASAQQLARDVSGLVKGVTNSETLEGEEQTSRASAQQLGDTASAPQQKENGQPVWFQLEQPQLGLPWGLQPSSCVDEIKPKFPAMQFRGQIVYSKTESEVNAATVELWRRVHELQETAEGAIPIGFDLEWRASFEKGEIPRKVAVLQLCLDGRRCDVMQIIYSGIPLSLQNLLEAPSTLKVGVGVYGDASKLRQDYQITTRKIADLRVIANQKMKNLKQWSLSSLALELTGKQVEKIKSIRCGDWEALPLSEPQLQYAATDAFASLHLYQVLASFPNPVQESNQIGSDDSKSDPEPPIT